MLTIGQEHVAVNALRRRFMGLARGWDLGFGPHVVLACPPREYHDVSLVLFGLSLHRRGWRVTFLGADTPIETLVEVCAALEPHHRVLYSPRWADHVALAPSLAQLSSRPTAIAGPTGKTVAALAGLRWLSSDPVTEAELLTREFAAQRLR